MAVLTSTHNLCVDQKCVKYHSFLSENFQFLEVIIYIFNRCVFLMVSVGVISFLLKWISFQRAHAMQLTLALLNKLR